MSSERAFSPCSIELLSLEKMSGANLYIPVETYCGVVFCFGFSVKFLSCSSEVVSTTP